MLKDDGNITMSYTELSTFIQCPYKHHLDYEQGLLSEKEQVEFMSFGTAIHEGIELLYETKDIQKSQNVFLEKFDALWKQHNHTEYDSFKDIGLIAISNLYQTGMVQKEQFQYKELEINHRLRDNVYFRGFIDLITLDPVKNKICIIDLKTTKNGWNDYQRKSLKTKAQLYLYQLILMEMYSSDASLFECKFVLIEYNNDHIEEFVLDGNPSDLKKTRELLDSIVDALYYQKGNRHLKFKNKNNCRFCPYLKNKELCTDSQQGEYVVVTEYQLYNIYERTEPKDDRLLVLPWRDIDYTKKQDVSDWRAKVINEIHRRKPNSTTGNVNEDIEEFSIQDDEEEGIVAEDTQENNVQKDPSVKKYNIYQERR